MPFHVGYGRKVGDHTDEENLQETDDYGRFAKGSTNPESERSADDNGSGGGNPPRREDFSSRAEWWNAFKEWRAKKPTEEPPVEEPKPEPEPKPTTTEEPKTNPSENDLYDFFANNDVRGLSQWEARSKADAIIRELKGARRFTFAKSFDNFADQRVRLACLLALKRASTDYPLPTEYGVLDIRTNKNRYWGDTQQTIVRDANGVPKMYKGNWIIMSSGGRDTKLRTFNITYKSSWKGVAGCTMEELIKEARDGQESGFKDKCSEMYTLCGTMVHEYAHNVHHAIANTLFQSGQTDKLQKGLKFVNEQIMRKALEMFPEEYHNDIAKAKKDASRYGQKNDDEWFAETFRSMYSDKPRKSALAMREILKLYY